MKNKVIKEAFKDSLPIMAGYIVLGTGFGILLESKGYGLLYAVLMSVFIYAGSMQYVGINLITGGASIIATAIMTIVVNIRHLFYGISMLSRYKEIKKHKTYTIFGLTDEVFSVVVDKKIPEDLNKDDYYFFVSLFSQSYWVIGSCFGSVVGTMLPFSTAGVEFSMTALFICVFVNQWENYHNHLPALVGLIVSIICLIIFGSSNFLIPSIILINVILIVLKDKAGINDAR